MRQTKRNDCQARTPRSDKILGLLQIANDIEKEQMLPLIRAGVGNPSFKMPESAIKSVMEYWQRQLMSGNAIDYGDFRGEPNIRAEVAALFSKQYKILIQKDEILMTVGAVGALNAAFTAIHAKNPHGVIVMPKPYYPRYAAAPNNHFYTMEVPTADGYQLTASFIDTLLDTANQYAIRKKTTLSALIICDPHNPLGTSISKSELSNMVEVLEKYPQIQIILDETYSELQLDGEGHRSLLTYADETLKKRLVVVRSGTKAFSASGERPAAMMVFDPALMTHILNANINCVGHAPLSTQNLYLAGLKEVVDNPNYLTALSQHYRGKVDYICTQLKSLGLSLEGNYAPKATFYVLANLNELIGIPLTQKVADKKGEWLRTNVLEEDVATDADIVMHLLVEHKVMLSPFSAFGGKTTDGKVRITCSAELDVLVNLIDRIKTAIVDALSYKIVRLIGNAASSKLTVLKSQLTPNQGELLTYFEKMARGKCHATSVTWLDSCGLFNNICLFNKEQLASLLSLDTLRDLHTKLFDIKNDSRLVSGGAPTSNLVQMSICTRGKTSEDIISNDSKPVTFAFDY